eukprot:TRINITY_DN1265_c1_g1_i1.p1 TRINITY_DN1265_c1_g1~~TRINITY_DN1265_c1_g1_i1.p1  ORF type:complete len:566 (+),score=217.29 TRINITY_DN1265_c1_g1_i1:113-1810(+)
MASPLEAPSGKSDSHHSISVAPNSDSQFANPPRRVDSMKAAFKDKRHDDHPDLLHQGPGRNLGVLALFVVFQVVIIILYGTCTDYSDLSKGAHGKTSQSDAEAQVEQYYPFFQHVHVMVFVGFGFLMTFLKRYTFGGLGFNFLVSAAALQWGILCNGFWHNVFFDKWEKITLDISTLITGDFAAAAVMITFGALLGKIGPLQLLLLGMLELIFYAINESIGVIEFQAVDMGGSIFVHMFGGFFGVAAAWVFTNKKHIKAAAKHAGSTPTTDTFAMIGTMFLWMYWPSFNGALAEGTARQRVVINTVLALCASCLAAFLASYALRGEGGRFNMVDIQNATLAGGVAVGSSSDLVIGAWPALLLGMLAGTMSVFGYNYISPWLEERFGIHDTCGVLNLHALPGLMGAIGGCISAAAVSDQVYGEDISTVFPARADGARSASEQAWYQAAATAVCLGISISSGILSAKIVTLVGSTLSPPGQNLFVDERYWEVEDDEHEDPQSAAVHPGGDEMFPRIAPGPQDGSDTVRPGEKDGVKEVARVLRALTADQFEALRRELFKGSPDVKNP